MCSKELSAIEQPHQKNKSTLSVLAWLQKHPDWKSLLGSVTEDGNIVGPVEVGYDSASFLLHLSEGACRVQAAFELGIEKVPVRTAIKMPQQEKSEQGRFAANGRVRKRDMGAVLQVKGSLLHLDLRDFQEVSSLDGITHSSSGIGGGGSTSNDDSTSNDNGKLQLERGCKRGGLRALGQVSYADEGGGGGANEKREDKKGKKGKKKTKRKDKKGKKGEEKTKYTMSPYELQREANIERNVIILKSLGLG
jgi:hypothetical protein